MTAAGRRVAMCVVAAVALSLAVATTDAKVIELDEPRFDKTVANGIWIVKFYAPWCAHCKALKPIFDKASERVSGLVNFADVDATVETGLKDRFGVDGYPTLKVFVDGVPRDYEGGRSEEGFAQYAARITGPGVHKVTSVKKLNQLTSDAVNPVVLTYHRSKGDNDSAQRAVFEKVAEDLKTKHTFAETSVDELVSRHDVPTPFIAKLEKGEESVYRPVGDGLEEDELREWVNENQFQVISSEEKFGALTKSGRLVVACIVDPEGKRRTRSFRKKVLQLARPGSPLTDAVRNRLHFMELDGTQWDEFIAKYNIKVDDLPRVVVFDKPNKLFYEDPEQAADDQLAGFLTAVVEGRVPAQSEGLWGEPMRYWRMAVEYSPWSFIIIAAVVGMLTYACCFAPDEDEGDYDEDVRPGAPRARKAHRD